MYTIYTDSDNATGDYLICMRCKNLYYSIVMEFTDNGGTVASYLNSC